MSNAKSGSYGQVQAVSVGTGVVFTKSATTTTDTKTFAITGVEFIDPSEPVVVYVDDVIYTGTWNVDFLRAKVFVANPLLGVVTVSGKKLATQVVGGFYEWGLDLSLDSEDTTSFDSEGWKEHTTIVKGGTADAKSFFDASESAKISGDTLSLLKLYVNTTSKERFVCFAVMTKRGNTAPVKGIIKADLSFSLTGEVVYFPN